MIDYSNGYPVQITTNVTKDTPWIDILSNALYIKPLVDTDTKDWKPSNYKGPDHSNYKDEEYKTVFLKLRYHGHIPNNSKYFEILDKYSLKYNTDKEFKSKVDRYIQMTEDLSKKPTNKIKWLHPDHPVFGKLVKIPSSERTEFGKQYYELENELISLFSKI